MRMAQGLRQIVKLALKFALVYAETVNFAFSHTLGETAPSAPTGDFAR